jgi:hypothetical protein
MKLQSFCAAALLVTAIASPVHAAAEWQGYLSLDYRQFFKDGLYQKQENAFPSLAFEPEYYREMRNDIALTFKPFIRLDAVDNDRSHIDIREFFLYYTKDNLEARFGLNTVFWGVTESRHLVDIINQTDAVENIDGEDMLGQPMINLTYAFDNSLVDFFVLLGFRERTFSGEEGRLRTPMVVDVDNPLYESSDGEEHVDYAVRWSGTVLDYWDIGLHYFTGTSRDPVFVPVIENGQPVKLAPKYFQIDQVGIDIQATLESWLLKLEAIQRNGEPEDYSAAVAGFEYTVPGIVESSTDLGIIAEYHTDSRGKQATTPFNNDLFIGTRWAFNDAQSTEVIAGVIADLDFTTRSYRIESSRRIGASWKLTGELQVFSNVDQQDVLYGLRNDSFLSVEMARYF